MTKREKILRLKQKPGDVERSTISIVTLAHGGCIMMASDSYASSALLFLTKGECRRLIKLLGGTP